MTGGLFRGTPGENIKATPSGISGNVFGSTSGGAPEVNVETPFVEATPSAREQIEGHLSALRSLLKEHNGQGNVSPIRLSFDDGEDRTKVRTVVTGKEVGDADLQRPFKEAVKTPITDPEDHLSRFSSAANLGEWPMPVWCRTFQQILDGSARGWFKNLSGRSIDGWVELRQQFTTSKVEGDGEVRVMTRGFGDLVAKLGDKVVMEVLVRCWSDGDVVPTSVPERECKLYDAFDKFTHIKGKSLHKYYLRFTQLINDINIYNMKMEQFQVNTKFLNSLPPEWSKFVTDVKLVKDLHTTNFDQLHAYLKQHELYANEVHLLRERNQDPLAFVANQQMTPSHFNTYQSSYNNPQFQQQFPPSQYGSIYPNQHYSSTYQSQPQFNQSSIPPSYLYQSQMNHQTSSVPQIGFAVLVFSPGDYPIACLNNAMPFLTAIASSRFPSTNN
ncbi:hypothetical protein Tco_0593865 [Tanacetum coccineum]